MSINIKNREAEQLLGEIKARTGRGTTDLLLDLLRREKARLDVDLARRIEEGLAIDRRFQQELAALKRAPTIEVCDPIEWDEDGLPV